MIGLLKAELIKPQGWEAYDQVEIAGRCTMRTAHWPSPARRYPRISPVAAK